MWFAANLWASEIVPCSRVAPRPSHHGQDCDWDEISHWQMCMRLKFRPSRADVGVIAQTHLGITGGATAVGEQARGLCRGRFVRGVCVSLLLLLLQLLLLCVCVCTSVRQSEGGKEALFQTEKMRGRELFQTEK
eukprot:4259954-Pleurochrysis_carterae.AAC.1